MSYKNGERATGGKCYRQSTGLKNQIRRRDNYTCQICGEYGDQVDHTSPFVISRDSTIPNLRVLCRSCNLATRRQRYDANPIDTLNKWYSYLETELAKC